MCPRFVLKHFPYQDVEKVRTRGKEHFLFSFSFSFSPLKPFLATFICPQHPGCENRPFLHPHSLILCVPHPGDAPGRGRDPGARTGAWRPGEQARQRLQQHLRDGLLGVRRLPAHQVWGPIRWNGQHRQNGTVVHNGGEGKRAHRCEFVHGFSRKKNVSCRLVSDDECQWKVGCGFNISEGKELIRSIRTAHAGGSRPWAHGNVVLPGQSLSLTRQPTPPPKNI